MTKKVWRKPELKRMVAGAAEKGSANNRADNVDKPTDQS